MLLNGKWTLFGENEKGEKFELTGTVPGCVHTDLIDNGIIKDIFYRDNNLKYQWIENKNFTYEKTFNIEKVEEKCFIEFDGLDTYCDVFLNGKKIGEADDMFIPYSFCADGAIKEGENVLTVKFRSPIEEVKDMPIHPGAFTKERMNTRRIQCTYSWDWVARFVTMGIYKDVRLVFCKPNEIDNFYLYTKNINKYCAQLHLTVNFRDHERNDDEIRMEILDPSGKTVFSKKRTVIENHLTEYIDIAEPALWYPNGYGEQPLYTLKLKTNYSEKTFAFGIREIVILQIPDTDEKTIALCRKIQSYPDISTYDKNEETSCFTVLCNGIKIFCRGADWVPCEPFPSNETPEKIEKTLMLAKNAGMNMVRVWGGGIFEQDSFYETCDRLGILVSQDFLMACGEYPEKEEWFIDRLRKEAENAAYRLRNHTCLVYWAGDNENAVSGTENTFNFRGYESAEYGAKPILEKLDPQRYFLASSPCGGNLYASLTKGTSHITNFVWPMFKFFVAGENNYLEYFDHFLSRFNVEQPALGMPFADCLRKFMTEEDIYGEDTTIHNYHTQSNPGLPKTIFEYLDLFTKGEFGDYTDGHDRILKMQMIHCEWIRFSYELYRRNMWFSSGILYWMLNDCWPAANSWSIIDYYNDPKPAYYAFKRASKPFVLSITGEDNKIKVFGSNVSLDKAKGKGKLYLYDYKANVNVKEFDFEIDMDENCAKELLCVDNDFEAENTVLLCDGETNLNSDRAMYIPNGYAPLNIPYNDIEIISEDEKTLTVRANGFTPFAIIDRTELFDDNCFVLKKGETKVVKKL